ncbi:MAG: hypothetical protein CMM87_05510 [Rickettsiales bacterium]|nr:hypothetical protein [Rickettsiales bacterium]|tara:strand:- start:1226 stop:1540 length:315 start_codon:yes stop_codon:yes gene_type:complete
MSRKKYKLINVFFYIIADKAIELGLISANNKIISMIRSHCFDDWSAFKVEVTMKDVDKQVKVIKAKAIEDTKREIEFRYSEIEKGPTPLGGPMRLSAPWKKKDK